jgi:arylsulfatase A-like enzyme
LHREWDHHGDLPRDLPLQCRDVDQACKGLIIDLKQRGLLDDTLVVWGGEFGRTVYCQGNCVVITMDAITTLVATRCGWPAEASRVDWFTDETDDFSYNIVKDPVHIRDLNATILHLMGNRP